jgi:DNA-binding MarR family transcriptional regulator
MKGRRISTSSLCMGAAVPSTTALRWIRHLEELGLVHREDSASDGRVNWQSLTPKGSNAMRECLSGFVTQLPAPIRRELRLVKG